MKPSVTRQKLVAHWITPEAFRPYGQLILPSADGKAYDRHDAQLHLERGTPRFYIMQLHQRGRQFHRITRHQQCTQCLGSLEGKVWAIAVAPPTSRDYPDLERLMAFRIPGNCFIKLEMGTWHAGPYFDEEVINFYNLELSDTNVVDHFTHDFHQSHGLEFEIELAEELSA